MSTRARMRAGSGARLVFLWALLIAACSTTLTGRRQLTLIDDDKMDALGVAAFADLKKEGKVSKDPALTQYVRCVADPILKITPKGGAAPKGGKWEIVVFEDSTPNAFALPGGKIGVHTGMLTVATTPGQLAAVIGHEIGHVLLRHGNERMSQSVVAQSVLEAGAITLDQMTPQYRDVVVGGLGVGAQYGVLLPFSRKHESEADVIGQKFMAEAGFNPAEAVTLWQKMAKLSKGQEPPQWMSTHPANETRIEKLRSNLPEAKKLYSKARKAGKGPQCEPPPTSAKR